MVGLIPFYFIVLTSTTEQVILGSAYGQLRETKTFMA